MTIVTLKINFNSSSLLGEGLGLPDSKGEVNRNEKDRSTKNKL